MAERQYSGSRPDHAHKGRWIAHKTFDALSRRFDLALSPQSQAYFEVLNQLLLERPAVMYTNHPSTWDAVVAVSAALTFLPNAQNIIGPVALKHYDWRRDPVGAAFLHSLPLVGIEPLPIVQPHDAEHYSPERRTELLAQLQERTNMLMNSPGSLYGITPEGTRNPPGMGKAKSGIMGFLRQFEQLVYLPVGIAYGSELSVGKPLTLQDVLEGQDPSTLTARQITDAHMIRLAHQLPYEQRGYYADK